MADLKLLLEAQLEAVYGGYLLINPREHTYITHLY